MFNKLDQNHKKIPDEYLLTNEKISMIKEGLYDTWIRISLNHNILNIERDIENIDELTTIFDKYWEMDHSINNIIVINSVLSDEEIRENQILYYNNVEKKNNRPWLNIYNKQNNKIIQPFESIKLSIFKRIKDRKKAKIIRYFKIGTKIEDVLRQIIKFDELTKSEKELLNQLDIKEKKLNNWKNRMVKTNKWDEDEIIVNSARVSTRKSNWKVRSNLTKRGRIVITNKQVIFIRRKFALFNFNPLTLIPLVAFVRPSNKVLLFFKTIYEFIKIPLQIVKGFKPAMGNIWIYIAAISFSIPNIDFDGFSIFFNNFFIKFPSLNFINIGLTYAFRYPTILPAFAGVLTGLRLGFLKLIMRGEEIIYFPIDQIKTLQVDRSLLVMRLKLKGSKLVKGPENGIEFKLRIINGDKDSNNEKLTKEIYGYLINKLEE